MYIMESVWFTCESDALAAEPAVLLCVVVAGLSDWLGGAGEARGEGEWDLCNWGEELLLLRSTLPWAGPDLCELRNTRWWPDPVRYTSK